MFINRGSTINLTCLVKFAPEPPPVMLWSHNREVSHHKMSFALKNYKYRVITKDDSDYAFTRK